MADAKEIVGKVVNALDEANDRDIAKALSWARCGAGAMLMMAPRRSVRTWTGLEADEPQTRMAARSLGARDLAIGVGTLFAISHGAPVRGWIEAGMLADACDAVGGLISLPNVPKLRDLLFTATSGASAFLGYRISGTIDE
jgi:hypothetical protein